MDLIANDPTNQTQSQVGLYGDGTDLNTYYCRKKCPQGYFYDFDSISCRQCGYGCAECEKFEECQSCVPGFRKFSSPEHSTHPVDKSAFSQCQLGCQDGFYMKSFKGTCGECDQDCALCVDSLFVLKDAYIRGVSPPSYCLSCIQNGAKKDQKKMINITTGKCQETCSSEANQKQAAIMGYENATFCHYCEPDCQECKVPETKVCLKCKISYRLLPNGSCIRWYNEPSNEVWIKFGIFSGIMIGVIILSLIIFVSIGQYLSNPGMKKRNLRNN